MAPRSMWNGEIAIGELVIPVKLYSVVQPRRVQFREVRLSDGAPIRHRQVSAASGEEVPREEIRKAYTRGDGAEVVLSDQEIAAAQPVNRKLIEIEQFSDGAQIDPVFYDKPYLLGAQPGAERAYVLLRAALDREGKVGIGRFTLRTREQLVALGAHGGALRLYTMRFADELVPAAELAASAATREPSGKEIDMAERLIDALAAPWEPERHEDRHRQALLELIARKAAGESVAAPSAKPPEPVPDLLAALTASVERSGKRRPSAQRRRRAAGERSPGERSPARTRTRSH